MDFQKFLLAEEHKDEGSLLRPKLKDCRVQATDVTAAWTEVCLVGLRLIGQRMFKFAQRNQWHWSNINFKDNFDFSVVDFQ